MNDQKPKPILRLLLVAIVLGLNGCYYVQAASGQLSIMSKREPIDKLLATDALPEPVALELRTLQRALAFAISELGLPDNGSYRSYVDLKRPYVVWNVFAAPELSLKPNQWCYPVVGCVAYRGYFSEKTATRLAEKLKRNGLDAVVRGSPAYSTLGRFKDPVLNTMLRGDPAQLVTTLFHELAHQQLYVADDVEFNESYATALADIGIDRWVAQEGGSDALERYRQRQERYRQFTALALQARASLEQVYESDISDDAKRQAKKAGFAALAAQYESLAKRLEIDTYPRAPNSNAELVPISTYYALIPDFRRVYEVCERKLSCFYSNVERMGGLDNPDERRIALTAFIEG